MLFIYNFVLYNRFDVSIKTKQKHRIVTYTNKDTAILCSFTFLSENTLPLIGLFQHSTFALQKYKITLHNTILIRGLIRFF